MTPEGSQSSEELLNVDESQSAAPSSSNNDVQIRVKNVSEINSNEAEANPSPPTKRKLPSWMLVSSPQQTSDSIKKRKTLSNEIQDASTSGAVDQPESTETPSTSRNYTETNADQSASTSHANDEEKVSADANANSAAEDKAEEETGVEPSGSNSAAVPVKVEPTDEDDSEAVGHITPTSARDIKPAVKVEKEEATSSTTRITCKFGIRCYRQNPNHRREEAHPGDKDYQRPDFPAPPDGTPSCPYGDLCYRRNPVHFQQFSHPPSTDFKQNWKNHKMRLRQRNQPTINPNASYSDLDDDDYDLEDPFIDDNSDDEFFPNTEEDDEDDFV